MHTTIKNMSFSDQI